MTRRDQLIAGVFVLVAIVLAYLVGLAGALRAKPASQATPPPGIASLEQDVLPLLGALELNGELPIAVSSEELGKDDPFKKQ